MKRWVMIGTTPTILSQGVPEFGCIVPVLPGGDGAGTEPLEARTATCHHATNVLIGSAPTCAHHLVLVAQIGEVPLEELLGSVVPLPCPEPPLLN